MLIPPFAVLDNILDSMIAAGPPQGDYNAVTIGLFTNDIDPGISTVLADLVPATFDGYAISAAVTWGTPYVNDEGYPEVAGDLKTFLCTGDTVQETIHGYYYVRAGTYKGAVRADAPEQVSDAGDAVLVVPRLKVTLASNVPPP